MFWLIKQLLIVLLSFDGSLARNCLFLSNEPCMNRHTLVNLNSFALNYYPFMISLDKCNGRCNVAHVMLEKYVFPVKQKT